MAENKAVNKVVFNGDTIIDLTGDTVSPDTLYKGRVAHAASGEPIVGTMEGGGGGDLDTEAIYKHLGKVGAKNLLEITGESGSVNDILYTVNDDGSVSIPGDQTASAETMILLTEYKTWDDYGLISGDGYIFSGCPEGGSNETYRLLIGSRTTDIVDTGSGATFTASDEAEHRVLIYIRSGYTVPSEGLTFNPMIRYAEDTDETFRARVKTNKQLMGEVDALSEEVKNASEELLDFDITLSNADLQLRELYVANGGNPVDEGPGSGLVPRYSDLKNLEKRKAGYAIIDSITSPAANAVRFNMTYEKANQPSEWVEAGILATNRTSVGLNMTVPYIDSLTPSGDVSYFHRYADISTIKAENPHSFTWNWTKGNTTDALWYVRAYYIYKDPEGNKHTVYGQTTGGMYSSSESSGIKVDVENGAGPCEVIEWADVETLKGDVVDLRGDIEGLTSEVTSANSLAGQAMSTASTASSRAAASETWEHNTKTGVHNLAKLIDIFSKTVDGITFDVYSTIGEITYSGTASGSPSALSVGDIYEFIKDNNSIILSIDKNDSAYQRVQLILRNGSTNVKTYEVNTTSDDGSSLTITDLASYAYDQALIMVVVSNGINVTDGLTRPLIRYAEDTDSTFAPYADTNLSLTSGVSDIKTANYGAGVNLLDFDTLAEAAAENGVVTKAGNSYTFEVGHSPSYYFSNEDIDVILSLSTYSSIGGNNGRIRLYNSANSMVGVVGNYGGEDILKARGKACYVKMDYASYRAGATSTFTEPMLRLASIADDTYYPHILTNAELTERTNGLYGNTGKNLLDFDKYLSNAPYDDLSYSVSGNVYTIQNYNRLNSSYSNYGYRYDLPLGHYVFTVSNATVGDLLYLFLKWGKDGVKTGEQSFANSSGVSTVEFYGDFIYLSYGTSGSNTTITITEPMIRLVDTTPEFEPYSKTNLELTRDTDGVRGVGRNLLAYECFPNGVTSNGITYTPLSDGTLSMSGTSGSNASYFEMKSSTLPAGTYIVEDLSGFLGKDNRYGTVYAVKNNVAIARSASTNEFTLDSDTLIQINIAIFANSTIPSGTIIKPVLYSAKYADDPTFYPYSQPEIEFQSKVRPVIFGAGASANADANAAVHNANCRGMDITSYFNDGGFSQAIKDGSFKDIYPGDYFILPMAAVTDRWSARTFTVIVDTLNPVKYMGESASISDNCIAFTTKETWFNSPWNSNGSTAGGYANSEIHAKINESAIISAWQAALSGKASLLQIESLLSTAVNTEVDSANLPGQKGMTSNWAWTKHYFKLFSEAERFGTVVWSSGGHNTGTAQLQSAYYAHNQAFKGNQRQSWDWLSDVVSVSGAAAAYGSGNADCTGVTNLRNVRPRGFMKGA